MSDELKSVEIGFRKEGHFVPACPTCEKAEAKVARLQAVIDRLVEAGAPMVRWVDPELFGPFRSAISAARGEQDA